MLGNIKWVVMLLCLTVAACSHTNNDYLKNSNEISPLVIPSHVPAIQQKDYYPIPKSSYSKTATQPDLTPPTMR